MPWTAPAINQPSVAKSVGVRGQAIQNKLTKYKTDPEYQNLLKRGMEADIATKEYNLEQLKSMEPLQKALLVDSQVLQTAQGVSWANYPQYKESMEKMASDLGVDNFRLPDPNEITQEALNAGITDIDSYFENQKQGFLLSIKDNIEYGLKNYEALTARMKAGAQNQPYKVGEIKDFKEGDQFIQKRWNGKNWEPTGTSAPRYKPTTNVNIDTGLTKSTQTKLQQDILDADEMLFNLEQAEDLFKEEYLTYKGQVKAKGAKFLDKLGFDTWDEYLDNQSAWEGIVDKQTLSYRKMITGVAGGEKEMKEIAKTYINTKTDSPTTYKSKQRIYRYNTLMAKKRSSEALKSFGKDFGELTPEQKAEIAKMYKFKYSRPKLSNEAQNYLESLGL